MSREGHQVDFQFGQVDFNLASGLGRIDMEQHAARASQLTNGSDVVDGADFVVHVHDRNQNGVITHGRFNHGRRHQTVGTWLDIRHFKAFALQLTHGVEDGLVFNLVGDQVLAFGGIEMRSTLDRQVVGLGRAGGPDNFTRVGVNQISNLTTAILNRFFSLPAKYVRTRRRVTEVAVNQQAVAHFLSNTRINRGSG